MSTPQSAVLRPLLHLSLDFSNVCVRRGDHPSAFHSLSRALKLSPSEPAALGQRGQLWLLLGNHESAMADFEKALQADDKSAAAHHGLAQCYLAKGDLAHAENCALRAATLEPWNTAFNDFLTALQLQSRTTGRTDNQPQSKNDTTPTPNAQARRALDEWLEKAGQLLNDVAAPTLHEDNLKNSRVVPIRDSILAFMPKGGICAEIGTQAGRFAQRLLSVLRPSALHLFDLDFAPFDRAPFEAAIHDGVVSLHQGDSSALLATFPERHFDFIYIDADHSYEGVVKDLAQAERVLKDSGWIVCNDYTLFSPLENIKYGVYRAVNEFCLQRGFEIVYLGLQLWGYHDVALRRIEPSPRSVEKDLASEPNGVHRNGCHHVGAGNTSPCERPSCQKSGEPARVTAPSSSGQGRVSGRTNHAPLIETIGPGDEMFTGDKDHYFRVGESALRCIETAFAATQKPNDSVRRVLDLPCGHGRVMRFLKASFPQAQLTACDLNRTAVDFCAKTFAAHPVYSELSVSHIPLRGKFDLIWCGSLLTHLRVESCVEFVALFQRLLEPGGLAVMTMHGRWTERLLSTSRYKYGLTDESVRTILWEYRDCGFGYADYPGASGYGISACTPAFFLANLLSHADLKLITYHEKGWDNHQDVICVQKQPADELLA
jgi:SAM-dependent methyltransferase